MRKASHALQPSNSTDALFRSWVEFILEVFTEGGWVQTADTGQIDITTVTRPTVSNQARGYAIFRMADGLSGLNPVFVRLDFGSSGSANNIGIWITIGGGSNGAGTIEPAYFTTLTSAQPSIRIGSSSTTLNPSFSFGSADTNRVQIGMFTSSGNTNLAVLFSIERTKGPSGRDSKSGVLLSYGQDNGRLDRFQYMIGEPLPQPPIEQGAPFILGSRNPSAVTQDVGAGIPFHFYGLAQQPGIGILVAWSSDWAWEAEINASVYKITHTYKVLGRQTIQGLNNTVNSGYLILMQYE